MMGRLRLFMILFCLALSVPLAYFVFRTHKSLEQEEIARFRFFGETLFNRMEKELEDFTASEESKAIDDYGGRAATRVENKPVGIRGSGGGASEPPKPFFVLAYLQNNPDGSFVSPSLEAESAPDGRTELLSRLEIVNDIFNGKRAVKGEADKDTSEKGADEKEAALFSAEEKREDTKRQKASGFAEQYLDVSGDMEKKSYLGRKSKRVEPISPDQAINMFRQQRQGLDAEQTQKDYGIEKNESWDFSAPQSSFSRRDDAAASVFAEDRMTETSASSPAPFSFQAEVAPLQSVFIDDELLFLFRRVAIDNLIYRQGAVIGIEAFLQHLSETSFSGQPMNQFAALDLTVADNGSRIAFLSAGAGRNQARSEAAITLSRRFPRPFSFLEARLSGFDLPKAEGRKTLNIMMAALGIVMLAGFLAIYQSARSVLDLAQRRNRFVSSVTHELKTPLTNIRMYAEMLEQGVASDRESELVYFGVLTSESARLSRLIENVLELSRLENNRRPIRTKKGDFEDVIEEVRGVMGEKLLAEGFSLRVEKEEISDFPYDRDAMVQVLINLMENSVKFGKNLPVRELTLRIARDGNRVVVSLSDTGPGIPRKELKKIFDDFYRGEGTAVQNTRGVGIGLAIVKKFVERMGGRVAAENNEDRGCTVKIAIPVKKGGLS